MKKLLYIMIIIQMMSCVSMRKFSSVNDSLSELKKDSVVKTEQLAEQKARIDELLRRNIALGRDTLRLFSDFTALVGEFDRLSEENRQEIVRLNAQLYGSSKRISNAKSGGRISKVATSLSASVSALGDEVQLILKNEKKGSYNIESKNWELVINLNDTLLYNGFMDNNKMVYDHTKLSRNGEQLLNKIASILAEKENFDIIVREYIYINSPYLQFIPSAKIMEETTANNEVVTAVIDTLVTRGVVAVVMKSADTSTNAVIDMEQSQRLDSLRSAREIDRVKRREIERMAEMARQRERERRKASDRTTVVMRSLMRYCYANLGTNRVSRDVSYMKASRNSEMPDCGYIEIILRPNIAELYNILNNENK